MKLNFFLLLLTFLAAVTLTSASDSSSGNNIKKITIGERRTTVVVINHTSDQLNLIPYSVNLSSGTWEQYPSDTISPSGGEVQWRCKASFARTEGSAIYQGAHGRITFYWANPFFNPNNVYSVTCPGYKCNWEEERDGDNAVVRFNIR
ncbi:hypothetical protein RhiirA5_406981 [Rhizophagus irregularis]|uniref:Uncharacterized protein n=1 Tax=Rhizophagus irregularis TaxID=588596 RepID=A0A2I1EKW3_9GLOM|nr:hypothetical protein RhiirA5_406981 [Rhizophagus irregularis]PKC72130.1 hypothetical protein RhiirA1_452678 [Rhizophagus irregularis]PKY22755.1 hypothetical protein RhiirB3_436780 [Rhizophagus irregularis]CAB4472733.1 unnamed protein product [Rhizophagus irregularis]CAB5344694.1 unnamed protein product [Rhizophagus irregularis]